MPDMKVVDTSKYTTEGKVQVDGNIWDVKLPGAGTELRINKITRRQRFLLAKVQSDTATEEDLNLLDELEEESLSFFKTIFNDGTPDNSTVVDWIDKTPMAVIVRAFEDIKEQADKAE